MDDDARGLHRRAWDLIPWVVNGSASEAESRWVALHLAGCADCRDELAFHRSLQAGISAGAGESQPVEPALARLWSQIDRAESGTGDGHREATPGPRSRHPRARWLVAAVVVQAVALGILGGALWGQDRTLRDAAYQTLTQPPTGSGSATIRLVVSPELRLGELRALLERQQLRIADTAADGASFGLRALPGASSTQADRLTGLRAEPGVLLAEPIHADAVPPR